MKKIYNRLKMPLWTWLKPNISQFFATQQPIIWCLSLLAGLGTSAAAIVFRETIDVIQWTWLHEASENIITAAAEAPWWHILLAPTIGGLIVGLFITFIQPGRRAGGVADVIEARAHAGRGLPFWPGIGSAFITAISLGSGASAGREGPVVHLGATISTALCATFNLQPAARRILLACGVAGAISASFNTPIAGVLFAHEVILGHYAISAFVPIVMASSVSTILSRSWFGEDAAFVIPAYQITSYWEFPAFALLGIVCALVAVIFQLSLTITDYTARNISMPLWLRPVIGGLIVGTIGIFFPHILGVGYEATDMALKNQLPIQLLLILLVAKTAATAITLASRFGGGVVAPSLYLGAMAGGAYGLIAESVFPDMASSQGLYSILGMGAVAASVLGAPISTTVMVFELTGGFALSIALLLTISISTGLAMAVNGRSFFHWQLESRGVMLQDGPHSHLARTVRVGDFVDLLSEDETSEPLDQNEPVLAPEDTLETALRLFAETGYDRLPVASNRMEMKIIGYALHVHALRYFNAALIDASVEEHR